MTQARPIEDYELANAKRVISAFREHSEYLNEKLTVLWARHNALRVTNRANVKFIQLISTMWALTLIAAIVGWAR